MLARQTPPDLPKMTQEEFFAWHARQEEKYELIDGYPVLKFQRDPLTGMAGGSAAHNLIAANVISALRPQLRKGGCRTFTSDMAVRVPDGRIRYPDASVDCGPFDPKATSVAAPALALEVLSSSTPWQEQNAKLADYQAVESLHYIVLVEQSRRYAQVWTRESGRWGLAEFEAPDSVLSFPRIEATLSFADLYEGVEPFEETAA